ncbi:Luciferin 4-monooxygenase [Gryllus bimaculatus]|nr:Luciferin 4-monooxygenase [Gryllus bimaculatus]
MNIINGEELKVDLSVPVWKYVYEKAWIYGERIAQVDAESGRSLTFRQMVELSQRVSRSLLRLGVRRGDVVAICSENNLEFCSVLLGALEAGAACMLIHPLYTPREFIHAMGISKPKIVLCSASVAKSQPEEVFTENDHVKAVLVWGCTPAILPAAYRKLEDFLATDDELLVTESHGETEVHLNGHQSETKNVALILSSSGSTGLPKGVMLTHSNIIVALANSAMYTSEKNITLGLMPFSHAYGLLLVLMCLCEGSKVIIVGKFTVDSFISNIQTYHINCLYLVPSLLVLLSKKKAIPSVDFKNIHHVWTGAAPVSPKVIDINSGEALGPNAKGELCFRGPSIMKGYMGNSDATKETIDNEGWLHSGDLGYYDSDHYFFIVDRLKELIKYQGHQVSPSELEAILLTHSAIQEAAVIGIPDEIYGELPQAHVIKDPATNITADEIQKFIAGKVAPHKRLYGGVKFVETIPKTPSGKIQRRELKQRV